MDEVDQRPIGVMDSGMGGLSILREIRAQLPDEDVIYFADQGHLPYGPRSYDEIRSFLRGIIQFFRAHDVKAVVIACNSASAAALYAMREAFPSMPFVGMEPAVKPAAENSRSGKIGVIATAATNQGELFASLIDRFANDVEVYTQACPDFVTLVEAGRTRGDAVQEAALIYLTPMLEAGVDQLVLGCTHFPFLRTALEDVAGSGVDIVDPAPAVARQTGRVIASHRNKPGRDGTVRYYTTGDPDRFHQLASTLLDTPIPRKDIHAATWHSDHLHA